MAASPGMQRPACGTIAPEIAGESTNEAHTGDQVERTEFTDQFAGFAAALSFDSAASDMTR